MAGTLSLECRSDASPGVADGADDEAELLLQPVPVCPPDRVVALRGVEAEYEKARDGIEPGRPAGGDELGDCRRQR